jgi:hypothetical protein
MQVNEFLSLSLLLRVVLIQFEETKIDERKEKFLLIELIFLCVNNS